MIDPVLAAYLSNQKTSSFQDILFKLIAKKNIDEVYQMLEDGSRKAREIAKETMKEFKEAMRICYFSDKELISHQKEKYNKD